MTTLNKLVEVIAKDVISNVLVETYYVEDARYVLGGIEETKTAMACYQAKAHMNCKNIVLDFLILASQDDEHQFDSTFLHPHYETMIKGGTYDGYRIRHLCITAALSYHNKILDLIFTEAPWYIRLKRFILKKLGLMKYV